MFESFTDEAREVLSAAGREANILHDEGLEPANRLVVGRVRDGTARVSLAATDGTVRIVLAVTADGTPSIRFLDADQKVIGRLRNRPVREQAWPGLRKSRGGVPVADDGFTLDVGEAQLNRCA